MRSHPESTPYLTNRRLDRDIALWMNDWNPPAAIDTAIRRWMKAHGFEVNCTSYDVSRELYAWEQEAEGQASTLRIAQFVLEYFTPQELTSWLDRLNAADVLRQHPHLVVRAKGDRIVLDTITGAPRTPRRRKNF